MIKDLMISNNEKSLVDFIAEFIKNITFDSDTSK